MIRKEYTHTIYEKRNNGKNVVKQLMVVSVLYDNEDGALDDIEVHLYENDRYVAEISKLLDKAEGCPLNTIIDSIDWSEL